MGENVRKIQHLLPQKYTNDHFVQLARSLRVKCRRGAAGKVGEMSSFLNNEAQLRHY